MAKTSINLVKQSRDLFNFNQQVFNNPVGLFYLILDESTLYKGYRKTTGSYPNEFKYNEEAGKNFPSGSEVFDISSTPYNANYFGKKVYINYGDFLLDPIELDYSNLTYESFFQPSPINGVTVANTSLNQLGSDVMSGNLYPLYVADIANSAPDFAPETNRYWSDGDTSVKMLKIDPNNYQPEWAGRTVFINWWNMWHDGQSINSFARVLYEELYVNGVVDYTKFPAKAYVENPANTDRTVFVPAPIGYFKANIKHSTLVLGQTNVTNFDKDSIYSKNINATETITAKTLKVTNLNDNNNNKFFLLRYGVGTESFKQLSTKTATGYGSISFGSSDSSGSFSISQGVDTESKGYASHSTGSLTIASGDFSHSGGYSNHPNFKVSATGKGSFNHSAIDANLNPNGIQFSSSGDKSVILGGLNHHITQPAHSSAIIAGELNKVESPASTVIGGSQNTVKSYSSSVIGGRDNTINSAESVILGGIYNTTNASAAGSVILGGNYIEATEPYTAYAANLVVRDDLKDTWGNYYLSHSKLAVTYMHQLLYIEEKHRHPNMVVSVEEGSTNYVTYGGKTHVIPREFILKPIITQHYVQGRPRSDMYLKSITTTPYLPTWEDTYNELHKEFPNQVKTFGGSTEAVPRNLLKQGATGYQMVAYNGSDYRTFLYQDNDANIEQLPEVGQTMDIMMWDSFDGKLKKVGTRRTTSLGSQTTSRGIYVITATYPIEAKELAYNFMGDLPDQSDVWIEMVYNDKIVLKSNKLIDLTGNKNGVNNTFTYSQDLENGSAMVYVNGMLQSPKAGDDYSVDYTNKVITFEFAPQSSDTVVVYGTC